MKNLYKQKRAQGFTIIEVMIVLAIAAVILLIVLLAVPALQRGSRNTQRANDAGTIAAAVNNCLSNKNGVVASCLTKSTSTVDLDYNKLGQFTAVTFSNTVAPAPGTVSAAVVTYGYKCDLTVAPPAQWSAGSAKGFVVTYQIETTGADTQKCIDG